MEPLSSMWIGEQITLSSYGSISFMEFHEIGPPECADILTLCE